MGWRFRRRKTLFPGVRLNLSTHGVSTTFGIPGASVNVGPRGSYLNLGIPGTGLYNRTRIGSSGQLPQDLNRPHVPVMEDPVMFVPQISNPIQSADNASLTSEGLRGVKETLLTAQQERATLQKEVAVGRAALSKAQRKLNLIHWIPFSRQFFPGTFAAQEQEVSDCSASLQEAECHLSECKVQIALELDPALSPYFQSLQMAFDALANCQVCWDITSSIEVDRVRRRSFASESVTRQRISLRRGQLNFISSAYDAFIMENANGATLYFYPGFLVVFRNMQDFGLIDFQDLEIQYFRVRFSEEETVPGDAVVVDRTWKYVNKSGSRDLRFADNYQIPVALYGEIQFKSTQGLSEAYQFSNAEVVERFTRAFADYKVHVGYKKGTRKKDEVLPLPAEVVNKKCSKCGTENPPEFKFCGDCGTPLFKPQVGKPN